MEIEMRTNDGDVISLRADYMSRAFGDLQKIADNLRSELDLNKLQVDTLIGVGLSGAFVVPTVARLLDYHWAIVRKTGSEGSHSSYPFEGVLGRRWLFVDDIIETGKTLKHVCDVVNAACRAYSPHSRTYTTTFVGSYQYQRLSLRLF